MPLDFGIVAIVFVGGIIAVLWGTKRFPEIARAFGKARAYIKLGALEGEAEIRKIEAELKLKP